MSGGLTLLPPSVDRHAHLEGSLDAAWVRQQAALEGKPIPATLEALWRTETIPFEGFIPAFFFSCGFLRSAEAAREILRAALRRLPPPEVGMPRGIDLWVSPHYLCAHEKLLSLDDLWRGMDDGIAEARAQGVKVAVILDAVNHFGVAHGHAVLDLVLGNLPEWVIGFSTGGIEGVPFREWAEVFERARKNGLRLAAHAGENGPGTNVRDAILEAGVSRIVHGVHAAAHPEILELLADRKIPVDVCITSNRALVPDLGPHPLPQMLRAGVRCALGTDDPGVMPCTIPSEWEAAKGLGLTHEELITLRRNAVEDAWSLQP
ncbi:MAG: amidohydrolase family protein [Holophaga sp.]|nr:amidohydrolase family protein [Holophaga sp.]